MSNSKKTVVTVTGIRPDFIRMSEVFKKFDAAFNHILVHTGQHYDKMLSDVFFDELNIRKPDYNLGIGSEGKEHFEQVGDLSTKIIHLLRNIEKETKVDCVVFLGDSNSVCSAIPIKKEGYKIAHIEAGMRSGDMRMLEEVNRITCDVVSDYLFTYHTDYSLNLRKENVKGQYFNVGNTIVEPTLIHKNPTGTKTSIVNPTGTKTSIVIVDIHRTKTSIVTVDIHRPENFKYQRRLKNILELVNHVGRTHQVKFLKFPRTMQYIKELNLPSWVTEKIEFVDLMSYKDYLKLQQQSAFIISDSGSAQEEAALLGTPVIVPRDFTERIQSVDNGCSIMLGVNRAFEYEDIHRIERFVSSFNPWVQWLGDGCTSSKITEHLQELL